MPPIWPIGWREQPAELDERLDAADRHGADGDLERAHHGDRNVIEVGDEDHERLHGAGHVLGAGAGPAEPVVAVPEDAPRLVLLAEGLDHLMAGDEFLQLGSSGPRCWSTGSVKWACDLRATSTVISVETGTETQGDQGQERRDPEHHGQRTDSIRTDMISCVRTWFSDCEMLSTSLVTRLRTSPRDLFLKVGGGQPVQFFLHGCPEAVHQAAGPPSAVSSPWIQLKSDVPDVHQATTASKRPSRSCSNTPL